MNLPTIIRDKHHEYLAAQMTSEVQAKALRFVSQLLQERLDAIVWNKFAKSTVECSSSEASELLREMIERVTRELQHWATGYSPIRWLWMLRRVPYRVFEGDLTTTVGYDRTLAEVIAMGKKSVIPSRSVKQGTLSYPLDSAVVTRLSRFCEGIRFLSQLHVHYRWAGKGSKVLFRKHELPRQLPDQRLREAIRIYDKRVENSARPLSRMGSLVGTSQLSAGMTDIVLVQGVSPVIQTIPKLPPEICEGEDRTGGMLVEATFVPSLIAIDQVGILLQDPRVDLSLVINAEAASLIYLLACSMSLILRHPTGFYSVLRNGYLIGNRESCLELLRLLFDEVPTMLAEILQASRLGSGDEVLTTLAKIEGKAWPLMAGPVFRSEGDMICVDLASATNRLEASLEFPRIQGQLANARAEHFENAVQGIIDGSRWRPRPEIRAMKGRTLRVNEQCISNIDAIGEEGSSLLLVSCKSLIYSAEYDCGEYKAIRNAASIVCDGIEEWEGVVGRIRDCPAGDNFDFSQFKCILGVVVTPMEVFVDLDTAERCAAPGLRASCSAQELAVWLGSGSDSVRSAGSQDAECGSGERHPE